MVNRSDAIDEFLSFHGPAYTHKDEALRNNRLFPMMMSNHTQHDLSIRRVAIRNYKSIGMCEVELSHLTILIGRNGAGKSNFLDALRFVSDSLQNSVDYAFKTRGGIESVRRRSTGHPRNLMIELTLSLSDDCTSKYTFEIGAKQKAGFIIKRERLSINRPDGKCIAHYSTQSGELRQSSEENMPPVSPDRLYLVAASSLPVFREVYDFLITMGFYNLNPEGMKELQSPDAGELLHHDGSNIASVLSRISTHSPDVLSRMRDYLRKIVPGITDVKRVSLGPKETLEFRQEVKGSKSPWKFYAGSMSDGTLRALGSLLAVSQFADPSSFSRMIGIEEPETALHPSAAGALMDALTEASEHTQILLTTHSPDLLDTFDVDRHTLLVVSSLQGETQIAPIDKASMQALREHLYSAGELHRKDQLEPDIEDLNRQKQLSLFSDEIHEPSSDQMLYKVDGDET